MLSRYGFEGEPEVIQQLENPMTIDFPDDGYNGHETVGSYTLTRLSRPIIKVKINIGNHVITVFNCHLKSKLGEYIKPAGADFAPEADLVHYLPAQRALGELRALLRRSAEAYVLRKLITEELVQDNPVMVLGDFNDSEYSVTSLMIKGEKPFKNYAWVRRHDAQHKVIATPSKMILLYARKWSNISLPVLKCSLSSTVSAIWFTPQPLVACMRVLIKSLCRNILFKGRPTILA